MYSKPIIYNELSSNEYSVWAKVNNGIDPSQWASLCRQIGNLSRNEFSGVVALVNAHLSLKSAVKRQVEGNLGIGDGQVGSREDCQGSREELPLLSVGPSGINGEFQREVSMDDIKTQNRLSEKGREMTEKKFSLYDFLCYKWRYVRNI